MLFCFACSKKMNPAAKKIAATGSCTDSIVVYKQVILPGIQKTDLDGNIIETRSFRYRVYLFSGTGNIKTDSLKIDEKKITVLQSALIKEKPLYWGNENKRVLVAETVCFVQEILAEYSPGYAAGETSENNIVLYYQKNGLANKINTKKVTMLEQMVTE